MKRKWYYLACLLMTGISLSGCKETKNVTESVVTEHSETSQNAGNMENAETSTLPEISEK